jgi:hypothetical protein
MRHIPLLFIPFLLYNAFAFLIFEDYQLDFREAAMVTIPMMSGAVFTLTVGATIVLLALIVLAVEVVKATRIGSASIVDHILATALLIVFLLEFLLVPEGATSTFFLLLVIALIDLICGFAVSIRSAARDVAID